MDHLLTAEEIEALPELDWYVNSSLEVTKDGGVSRNGFDVAPETVREWKGQFADLARKGQLEEASRAKRIKPYFFISSGLAA